MAASVPLRKEATMRTVRRPTTSGTRSRQPQTLIAILMAFLLGLSVALPFVFARGTTPVSFETAYICVMEGDSLWTIGAQHPIQGKSNTECMDWITQANNLQGTLIRPGQVLLVPA